MRSAQGTLPPLAGDLPRDWRRLRLYIFNRDGYRCVQCGRRGRLECDHIEPREAGGSDHPDNLQTLCRRCHIAKTRADRGQELTPDQEDWQEFMTLGRAERRRRYGRS